MPGRKKKKGPAVQSELAWLPVRLERALAIREWDQPKLATKSGVSQSTISKALGGKNLKGITANTVIAMAAALRVPTGWLLGGEGDTVPQRSGEPELPESSVQPSRR